MSVSGWAASPFSTDGGTVATSAPAMADNTEKTTMTVSYAGLDLNTIEGQKLLEQRVEIAARRVCNYNRTQTGTLIRTKARECLAKARASASQQVAAIIEDQRRGG